MYVSEICAEGIFVAYDILRNETKQIFKGLFIGKKNPFFLALTYHK